MIFLRFAVSAKRLSDCAEEMEPKLTTGQLPKGSAESDYHPVSRRPIADGFRRTAHWAVRVCIQLNIHPDAISYFSIVMAGAGAFCFWQAGKHPWLFILGPAFCYARLWCNMLDGMVALTSGKASWRGEILNDLPDRISDVLIFVGLAHSGLNSVMSGYWAAIFALLTAYVGLFGQAVGVQREFSGIMSKPWRMVMVHLGSWVTLALLWWGNSQIYWGSPSVLDWTCIIIIAGCIQTIWTRLARIMRALREKAPKQ